jgi:hypothetical protein
MTLRAGRSPTSRLIVTMAGPSRAAVEIRRARSSHTNRHADLGLARRPGLARATGGSRARPGTGGRSGEAAGRRGVTGPATRQDAGRAPIERRGGRRPGSRPGRPVLHMAGCASWTVSAPPGTKTRATSNTSAVALRPSGSTSTSEPGGVAAPAGRRQYRGILGFLLFSHAWTWALWALAGLSSESVWDVPGVVLVVIGGAGVFLGGIYMSRTTYGPAGLREPGTTRRRPPPHLRASRSSLTRARTWPRGSSRPARRAMWSAFP